MERPTPGSFTPMPDDPSLESRAVGPAPWLYLEYAEVLKEMGLNAIFHRASALNTSDAANIRSGRPIRLRQFVQAMIYPLEKRIGLSHARMALETIGLVAFFALIESVFLRAEAQGLRSSLYWIPVAFLTAQYGSRGGLLATMAATAACYGLHGLSRPPAQDYYVYAASLVAQPSIWLAYSLTLGGLRDLQKAKETETEDKLAKTKEAADLIAESFERTVNEIQKLEMRIASDRGTLDNFLRTLANLNIHTEAEFLSSFAELVREATQAEIVTVMMREEVGFKLVARVCDEQAAAPATPAPPAPLIATTLAKRKAVLWEDPMSSLGAMRGICAAPIYSGANSVIKGVLVVNVAAQGEELRQVMRRAERLGQLLGNVLDLPAQTRKKEVFSIERSS